jgi:hypothetical protein
MSDIKKIKDEYLNKLDNDLDTESVNQIKTELLQNGKKDTTARLSQSHKAKNAKAGQNGPLSLKLAARKTR